MSPKVTKVSKKLLVLQTLSPALVRQIFAIVHEHFMEEEEKSFAVNVLAWTVPLSLLR
jgi:hypothetical protein